MTRDALSETILRHAKRHGYSVASEQTRTTPGRPWHIAFHKGEKKVVFQLQGQDIGTLGTGYFDFNRRMGEFKKNAPEKRVLALFTTDLAGKEKKDTYNAIKLRIPSGITVCGPRAESVDIESVFE
jgi:hypothetical protein